MEAPMKPMERSNGKQDDVAVDKVRGLESTRQVHLLWKVPWPRLMQGCKAQLSEGHGTVNATEETRVCDSVELESKSEQER